MSNLEATLSQNNLYDKMLAKYKNLKKEKEDIALEFSKLQKEYESYKIKEQFRYSDLQKENSRLNQIIHDLKSENKNFSTKLTFRDQEIKSLNSRFETKLTMDEKNKERDVNLFAKLVGRKPIITNSQDSKFLTIISTYENQQEKYEKKIKEMEKELMSARCSVPMTPSEDFHGKNNKIIQRNLMEKIEELSEERKNLEFDYHNLNENHNKVKIEVDKLTMKNEDLYKLFEKMKAQNAVLQQKLSMTQQNFENNKENVPQNGLFSKKTERSEEKSKKEEVSNESLLLLKICEIFSVKDYKDLLVSVLKTEKVMKAVPKLEQMIMEICNIVLPKVGLEVTQSNIDKLIPSLKQWSNNQDLFVDIVNFKNNLLEKLELQNKQATEIDIYQAIDNLQNMIHSINEEKEIILEEKEKLLYDHLMKKESVSKNMMVIYKMFEVDNEEELMTKISYIFSQFQELQRFINIGKKFIGLEEMTPNEICLTQMLKVLERVKMNKKEDFDFLIKLENEFKGMDYDHVLKKIKSMRSHL